MQNLMNSPPFRKKKVAALDSLGEEPAVLWLACNASR
jgi:hypothetical protein